jgi:hypothetical protein
MYVILMNRAIDRNWTQGGIYVAFNRSLTSPGDWTEPKKILERKDVADDPAKIPGWYPQVIGTDILKKETDKVAGKTARLFVHGQSRWEIIFLKPVESAR